MYMFTIFEQCQQNQEANWSVNEPFSKVVLDSRREHLSTNNQFRPIGFGAIHRHSIKCTPGWVMDGWTHDKPMIFTRVSHAEPCWTPQSVTATGDEQRASLGLCQAAMVAMTHGKCSMCIHFNIVDDPMIHMFPLYLILCLDNLHGCYIWILKSPDNLR